MRIAAPVSAILGCGARRVGAIDVKGRLMVMVVFVLIAVLVILGAVLVLTGRVDPSVATDDRQQPTPLPAGPLTAADVRGLTFRVGLRGYRMQDVDAALAAMAAELERRDATT